jgi:hypothetical protein
VSLSEFINRLNDNLFTYESISGFDLIDVDKKSLHARFIQKLPFENVVIDPFGEETKYTGVNFQIVEFVIYQIENNIYALKLMAPPRSIKPFINAIYSLCGFGVTLSDLEVDVFLFIGLLKEKLSPHSIKINKVKVSGLKVGEQSTANMELTSPNDALEDFLSTYITSTVNIKMAKIQIQQTELSGCIEITQSCMINIDESLEDLVSNLIAVFIREQK